MSLSDDLLLGAKAIASETGIPISTVYRLADQGEIPTFKLGGTLAARRSELRERLSGRASAA